jgi:hypothetical protein
MKIPFLFRWMALGAALLALSGCATTQQPAVPGTLKVAVNVPPALNILVEDRISEAFTDRVREVFDRAGFDRPVEEARFADDAANAPYLLTIDLIEWRINPIGNIDCTFRASLQTPGGTRDLGVYSNTTMRAMRSPGRWGLSYAFDDAAEGAIQNLCDAVKKSELLPGFAQGQLYSHVPQAGAKASAA